MRKVTLIIIYFLVIAVNCFAQERISSYADLSLSGTWGGGSSYGDKNSLYSFCGTCYWRINDYFHIGPGFNASLATAKSRVYGGGDGRNYVSRIDFALLPSFAVKGVLPTKSLVSIFASADVGPQVWMEEKIKVNVFVSSKLGVKFKLQQTDKSVYVAGVFQFIPATRNQAFIGLGGVCIGIEL